jgi:predicted  nucleic acid-binding Zn ribbon protein
MILAKVTFGKYEKHKAAELEDLMETYLASLLHNGQICSDYFFAWTKGQMNAYVHLVGPNGYSRRYHSKWGKDNLKNLAEAFGQEPSWLILEDGAPKRNSTWRGAPFLYLFTHAFDEGPPIRRGDKGMPIPSYLFPIDKGQLYSWQRDYYYFDNIWIGSGALEMPAYRQLADPKSELSQEGRELCQAIERATGIPTYYFLMRYWGRREGEEKRRCPGCGRLWRSETPLKQNSLEKRNTFWKFPFKCNKCRLVSHLADSDDGRRASIGEYRKQDKE